MSDFIPKPGTIKIGGLSRAAQKLQSAREKAAAQGKAGEKLNTKANAAAFKGKELAGTRKTTFQRKAV